LSPLQSSFGSRAVKGRDRWHHRVWSSSHC